MPQPVAATPVGGTFILLNARSGKKDQQITKADLHAAVPGHCKLHRLQKGETPGQIVRDAMDAGYATIVAAGGDGTIAGVAAAMLGSDCRLGVIPLGTFNFFARGLGVPEDPAEAIRLIGTGATTMIHVGTVNGRPFLNNVSLGIYPAILSQRESVYRRWGRSRMAAYWSVVRTIVSLYRPQTLRVTIDGTVLRYRTPLVFGATSAYQLDTFGLDGAAAIRRGDLALFVAPDRERFALIWHTALLAMRGIQRGRDFEMVTGRDILIETRRAGSLVACDREIERMQAPYRIEMQRNALRVIVPADRAQDG